jgi:subtilisin family serine protease
MYIWFHEGANTNLYIFDTGVYPDHSDWEDRKGNSRLVAPLICAGEAGDYALTDHGTHIASIAGGWSHGTAKGATIHPIQVLDRHGEGSTASVLCGVDRLLRDGKEFNAANAPKRFQAVVNLSLGVNGRSDALDKAVQDMTAAGYTVVIAAGDQSGACGARAVEAADGGLADGVPHLTCRFPRSRSYRGTANACFSSPYDGSAITVGALQNHPMGFNDKTLSSNYGGCIDLFAAGEDIVGASNAGEYESASMSGTSVAAAFVAGAATLFCEEVNPEEHEDNARAAYVKAKIVRKAEVNVLGVIGHGSPNKNAQTTASKCEVNAHCMAGLTCLRDGSCRNLSKPLTK